MGGTVLLGARVLPMTRPDAVAQAVAWEDGRILYVGDDTGARRLGRERGLETIPAEGRVVLPGFVDAHTHLLHEGMKVQRPDLHAARSGEELLDIVAGWLKAHPGSGPVIGEGFDETAWDRPRLPTRGDLDTVSGDRPLAVRRVCGHVAVANSAALPAVLSRWSGPSEVHPGSGLLLESPSLYLNEALPASAAEMDKALMVACRVAHGIGVTAVGDYAQAPNRAALQRAAALDRLRLRVHSSIYVQQLQAEIRRGFCTGRRAVGPDDPEADPARWSPAVGEEGTAGSLPGTGHFGPVPGKGGGTSPWLTDGGLKVFLDGSIGGHTALLRQPYADTPDCGMRNWTDDEVGSWFRQAHDAEIQLHAHAIGDGAIAQALDGFERLRRQEGPTAPLSSPPAPPPPPFRLRRHRIEHYELASEDLVERTVALGVVASCQPNFVGAWSQPGGMYEARLGERFRDNNRYRTWQQQGLRVCFGSDGMPFGPLYGIECATMRTDASERIPIAEALWLYTATSAWSLLDGSIGTLAPDRHADLVVLETKDLSGPPSQWGIHQTYVAGEAMVAPLGPYLPH